LFHRKTLYRKEPLLQHLFFISSGIAIGVFNNGECSEMYLFHSL